MGVVDDSYGAQLKIEEHAVMPLAGGIAMMGYQCGQVWGAALAAGARAKEVYGPGAAARAATLRASERLAARFAGSYPSLNCSDMTGLEWKETDVKAVAKYVALGGPIKCFSMAAGYALVARREIDGEFAAAQAEPPAGPISCASLLAERLGASEERAVMVAGFAGGIGLSGEACGALGAALWFMSLSRQEQGGQVEFTGPSVDALIERFLSAIDGDFECASIVGRKFRDTEDHAAYVASGGCARIIDALATIAA
jgi:hypothetical protein